MNKATLYKNFMALSKEQKEDLRTQWAEDGVPEDEFSRNYEPSDY